MAEITTTVPDTYIDDSITLITIVVPIAKVALNDAVFREEAHHFVASAAGEAARRQLQTLMLSRR